MPWEVSCPPGDPKDAGWSCEAVIRVDGRSGKGGAAYILETEFAFDLSRPLRSATAYVM